MHTLFSGSCRWAWGLGGSFSLKKYSQNLLLIYKDIEKDKIIRIVR